jgi:hypothetical protein
MGIVSRVDDHRLLRGLRPDDIAVSLEHPRDQAFEYQTPPPRHILLEEGDAGKVPLPLNGHRPTGLHDQMKLSIFDLGVTGPWPLPVRGSLTPYSSTFRGLHLSKRSPTKGEEGISPRTANYGLVEEPDRLAEVKRLPAPSTAEVISALSEGLDLAEGRAMGHAERVCYIATNLARALDLSAQEQIDVYYAESASRRQRANGVSPALTSHWDKRGYPLCSIATKGT